MDISTWVMPKSPYVKFLKYGHIKTAQNPQALELFKELASSYSFDYIFEIGTYTGAFTAILREVFPDSVRIISTDIEPAPLEVEGVEYLTEDCFNLSLPEGKGLILCDGGDKVEEFKHFAQQLSPGSVICAHDYCRKRELLDRKIWLTCEITYEDIAETVEDCSLKQVMKAHKHSMWAVFEKI